MAEALLERIPVERRWEIATESYTGASMAYVQALLEIVGKEKLGEIEAKMWSEGNKMFYPMIKEEFKMPVENAVDAANLSDLTVMLTMGSGYEAERIEETEKKVVERWSKCPWWKMANDYGIADKYDCTSICAVSIEEGLKAINPKLTCKVTKTLPRGDPYCEFIYELKK
jgi:hypothetical protein